MEYHAEWTLPASLFKRLSRDPPVFWQSPELEIPGSTLCFRMIYHRPSTRDPWAQFTLCNHRLEMLECTNAVTDIAGVHVIYYGGHTYWLTVMVEPEKAQRRDRKPKEPRLT